MKSLLNSTTLVLAALALAACGLVQSPTPGLDSETLRSELASYRQDLAPGIVVSFVEGLTPEMPGKVAYVTHVPSGSQAVLERDAKMIHRHDGRADGAGRLDALLGDVAAMARITEGLTNGEDLRPQMHTINWVPLIKFGSIKYVKLGKQAGPATPEGGADLRIEDLGPELYRIAFRGDGYAGPNYRHQDGDATHLNPGTQVFVVKGYSPQFRLGTVEEGKAVLYEADTNPFAKTGANLLDIRGKVTTIDILNDDDALTVLATIDDERTVERFIEMVLGAPVDQGSNDYGGPRYFLGLRLEDGTSVVRAFWMETGELSRGIIAGPEAASIVSSALPND